MRAVALVCLLFVAGSCAMPQSEVGVAEDRIVDLWILDLINRLRTLILIYRLDPMEIEKHIFYVTIIDDLLEIEGFVESFRFTGLSDSRIHDLRYNIVFGHLIMDLELVELAVSIGKYFVRLSYGGHDHELEVKGSFAISGIRIAGDAIIEARPGYVNIIAINPNCRIGNIQADLSVVGTQDYSATVNNFLNNTLLALLERFSREVNEGIGRFIRRLVEWYWPRF